jgi:hypothetical protein
MLFFVALWVVGMLLAWRRYEPHRPIDLVAARDRTVPVRGLAPSHRPDPGAPLDLEVAARPTTYQVVPDGFDAEVLGNGPSATPA